jgi:hypothetical protein
MLKRRIAQEEKSFVQLALYKYTGNPQILTLDRSGLYKIECWGAMGNSGYKGDISWPYYNLPGEGSYVSGIINLQSGTKLYIIVGNGANSGSIQGTIGANYNGGGYGGTLTNDGSYEGSTITMASGGGATDVRLTYNSDIYEISSLNSRIIVAAGGGGGGCYYNIGKGGEGGGLVGYLGGRRNGTGATQTAGGFNTGNNRTNGNKGSLGRGGNRSLDCNDSGYCTRSSGGGGGLYGGPSGGISINATQTGGGGSSYISGHPGCTTYSTYRFSDTIMIDGKGYKWTDSIGDLQKIPNPNGGYYDLGVGHKDKGYCRISIYK